MLRDFTTDVTGGFFVAGALKLWGSWVFLPRRVELFFQSVDFSAIGAQLRLWLWLYRVHPFSVVVSALALVALAALVANQTALRILVWPGVAVAVAGLIVGAASYYHFGVWSALQTRKSPDAAMDLVESLHVLTHYVTCLCALDVFCGLGLTVLAIGLLRGGIFAVRLLVYGLSLPVHEAVGVSLAAVGATALVGAVQRYWRGETDVCTGVIFAIAGMIGALLGESVHPLNEQDK